MSQLSRPVEYCPVRFKKRFKKIYFLQKEKQPLIMAEDDRYDSFTNSQSQQSLGSQDWTLSQVLFLFIVINCDTLFFYTHF